MERFWVGCASALLAACAAKPVPVPVDEVLIAKDAKPASSEEALAHWDAVSEAAIAAAQAAQEDAAAQAAASRALARSADLRLLLFQARGPQGLDVDGWVGLDDEAGDAVREEVLSLCSRGYALGQRAVELAPEDPTARTYRVLNLSLLAWAEGTSTALLRGRGPALAKSLKGLAADHPGFHAAGPLRLRGRFLDRAPWPYGDQDEAIAVLQRAVELAPIPINWQFLGDVLWTAGDAAGARAAWEAGGAAEGDPELEYGSELRRLLCRSRLAALPQGE